MMLEPRHYKKSRVWKFFEDLIGAKRLRELEREKRPLTLDDPEPDDDEIAELVAEYESLDVKDNFPID